jgi:hypothetical protein
MSIPRPRSLRPRIPGTGPVVPDCHSKQIPERLTGFNQGCVSALGSGRPSRSQTALPECFTHQGLHRELIDSSLTVPTDRLDHCRLCTLPGTGLTYQDLLASALTLCIPHRQPPARVVQHRAIVPEDRIWVPGQALPRRPAAMLKRRTSLGDTAQD